MKKKYTLNELKMNLFYLEKKFTQNPILSPEDSIEWAKIQKAIMELEERKETTQWLKKPYIYIIF